MSLVSRMLSQYGQEVKFYRLGLTKYVARFHVSWPRRLDNFLVTELVVYLVYNVFFYLS